MTDENPEPDFMEAALRALDFAVSNIDDSISASQVRLVAAKNQIHQVKEKVTEMVTMLRALASCYERESKVAGSHYLRSTVLSEVASDIRAVLRGEENELGPTFHQEVARLAHSESNIIARIDLYLEGATSEYQDHSDGCSLLAEARTALAGQSKITE